MTGRPEFSKHGLHSRAEIPAALRQKMKIITGQLRHQSLRTLWRVEQIKLNRAKLLHAI